VKIIKIPILTLGLVLAGGAGLPATAAQQEGLVNVNVELVKNEIAKNIDVDVSQIPVTVQVPVGIAANVCNVDANVLAQEKQGEQTANCDAQTTSQALNQVVQKQIN
jgi:hypothetical protein